MTLPSSGGGTNNILNATGLSVPGTSTNIGNPVSLPFSLKVAVASDGNNFTDAEKVDFQASFGGLFAFMAALSNRVTLIVYLEKLPAPSRSIKPIVSIIPFRGMCCTT